MMEGNRSCSRVSSVDASTARKLHARIPVWCRPRFHVFLHSTVYEVWNCLHVTWCCDGSLCMSAVDAAWRHQSWPPRQPGEKKRKSRPAAVHACSSNPTRVLRSHTRAHTCSRVAVQSGLAASSCGGLLPPITENQGAEKLHYRSHFMFIQADPLETAQSLKCFNHAF